METLSLLSLIRSSRLPIIRQNEAAECGLACLAMVLGHYGRRTDLITLRRRFSLSLNGATLQQIMTYAGHLGLASRPVRLDLHELKDLKRPAILHWELNHFVVLKSVGRKTIEVHDPARGIRILPMEEASKAFTGVALELTPTHGFEKKQERERLKLLDFWKSVSGLKGALVQVFALSLILQIFTLASPFYTQLVIDEALSRMDSGLLSMLALGFGLLVLLQTVTSVIRQYTGMYLGTLLNFQMIGNLMHHLMRLPQSWFEARHMGDITSRFGSTAPIQGIVTGGFIGAVLNVITFIGSSILIFFYSPLLATVVIGFLIAYLALRLALFRPMRQLAEESLVVQAKENSLFMETIRGIQPIKLFGREVDRMAVWQNAFADSVNVGVRNQRFGIWVGVANTFLSAAQNIVIFYLGAQMVIDGQFTIGMLVAFSAYKGHFEGSAVALVDGAIGLRMLNLHLERLGDIGLAEREKGLENDTATQTTRPLQGHIEVRHLSFRYAESEPDILKDVNFDIRPGEHVVLAGPSGGGKTTLMKLLLGLLEPTKGEIRVDGLPMNIFGRQAFRSQIGAVMQDDALLSGSIAENIAFFDPSIDLVRVEACAHAARIHEEIVRLPMGYQSLIGDMGSTLSGGQRQRILLARAIYRQPRLLMMDEGTANLDPILEQHITQFIASLPITRISIAHRPNLMKVADRVLVVAKGQIANLNQSTRLIAAAE